METKFLVAVLIFCLVPSPAVPSASAHLSQQAPPPDPEVICLLCECCPGVIPPPGTCCECCSQPDPLTESSSGGAFL
ncbi:hypothetical protein ACHQM5_029860 [Ranunculus cassubicifolius]